LFQFHFTRITNKIENTIFAAEHMIVKKKQVPDPEIIMKNYVIAYEQGLGSLNPEDKRRYHLVHL